MDKIVTKCLFLPEKELIFYNCFLPSAAIDVLLAPLQCLPRSENNYPESYPRTKGSILK